MSDAGSGQFAGRDAPPVVSTAVPPAACVLDNRRLGQRALITGASSGIGKTFAEMLAADGWNLTIVSRNTSRLNELSQALSTLHKIDVRVIEADLTRLEDMRRIASEISSDDSLDLVINNAGVAGLSNIADTALDTLIDMVQLNSVSVLALSHAAVSAMGVRNRGAIINVSSAGAFVAAPASATYCASKAFVSSLTEALSGEVAGTNVQVQALCPGMTETEMHQRGGFDVSWVPSWMTPEQVVSASFAGLRMGEVVCVPGLQDPEIPIEMRNVGARVVEQTIQSVVAPRYKTASTADASTA